MQMHNPPHPGEILKELYLDPLHLTVTETAFGLNVTRKTLSALLNGRAGVSPEMALKLAIAFDTTPEHWLNLQQIYTLWKAKQETNMQDMRNVRHFFEVSSDSQERSFPKFV
ncbi:MAG: addiction module antidote protein, HigA family [Alphaproteobacteria bacterium 16-39-46]|nr:MAG: addiction module antidote protein, HigA family [Alphaproteobacteria bacterium 16-39-46]OZA43137.1 MAG: addiction module antidote protein, HigA family [Alphaproteobacteria bacterium 17-39-52]HQS84020.1 HigA family addiction module antitoxin [Alphaproteobacteria bacterium]HQS93637.1 HigA family addiction module antitoxin [Alphaproteobacteria bacterium]